MVFGTDREFPPLYGFGWTPARRVHLRYDDTHPVGGSPAPEDRGDRRSRSLSSAASTSPCAAGTRPSTAPTIRAASRYDKPYPPFHDLMVAVDGEAAREPRRAGARALAAGHRPALGPLAAAHDPWPRALAPDCDRSRSASRAPCRRAARSRAVREIEKLYLDMIAARAAHLYIENQYFTAPRIAAALEKRLAEPDGPGDRRWCCGCSATAGSRSHDARAAHAPHRSACRRPTATAASTSTTRTSRGLAEGCCLDVHSKLMIVDDRVLRIGSSNLCNRSMGLDSECDVAIEPRGRQEVARNAIRAVRDRLLAEHLGVPNAEACAQGRCSGRRSARPSHELGSPARCRLREVASSTAATGRKRRVNVAAVADPEEPIALEELLDRARDRGAAGAASRRGASSRSPRCWLIAFAGRSGAGRRSRRRQRRERDRVGARTSARSWWAPLAS